MKVDQRHVVPGLTARLREQIYEHVFMNDQGEVGGVLVGKAQPGKIAIVRAAIPALEAQGARASVTFTHEAWAKVHAVMEEKYQDLTIVGWYHSHPGFGIFLSGHDLFIHENFFSEKSSVAYVIDPHAGEEGVFGWRSGEVQLLYKGPTTWEATRAGAARPNPDARYRVQGDADEAPPQARPRVAPRKPRLPLTPLILLVLIGFIAGLGVTLVLASGGNDKPSQKSPLAPEKPPEPLPKSASKTTPSTNGPRGTTSTSTATTPDRTGSGPRNSESGAPRQPGRSTTVPSTTTESGG